MSEPLPSIKYRVVGALVIVLSFAFAWWVLLDHELQRFDHTLSADIPERVQIERFEIPAAPEMPEPKSHKEPTNTTETDVKVAIKSEPKSSPKPKENSTQKAPEEAESETKNKVADAKNSPVQLKENKLPQAWVLQVASFNKKESAQSLERKLLTDKYPAYVKRFNLKQGVVYRVLVGPKLEKAKAQSMAKAIEAKFNLKTMITNFKPGFEE